MNLLIYLQTTALSTPMADAATQVPKTMNYMEMAFKGGLIMIPLLILSFVSVYIFIERYLAIIKASKEDAGFIVITSYSIHYTKLYDPPETRRHRNGNSGC